MAAGQRPPSAILIVCCGNTCRSPMAVGIARGLLGPAVRIESAGIETAEGLPATRDAVSVMHELGVDISAHRSRDIGAVNIDIFDLFVAMTSSIASHLERIGAQPAKIVTLDVPDPYGQGIEVYRNTAAAISDSLRRIF